MTPETIYDQPLYYDILFGWDRSVEATFYQRIFARYQVPIAGPIIEVACGTARVARLLAGRGVVVAGFDSRPPMVAFARERAHADKVELTVFCADMTRFTTESPFAAAYNPLSSFRLLRSDADAEAHLRQVARALRPGGVYVLDMDFQSDGNAPAITTLESWTMTRGDVSVRAEDDAVYVNDAGVERVLGWGAETHLRGYTASALSRLVDAVPDLRIESWHPEATRATGVSEFDEAPAAEPPVGRAMVVLRRINRQGRSFTSAARASDIL